MKTGRSKAVVVFKENATNVSTQQMLKKSAAAIITEAYGDKENTVEKTHAAISGTDSMKSKLTESTLAETKDKLKRTAVYVDSVGEKKVQGNASCYEKIQIPESTNVGTKDKLKRTATYVENVGEKKVQGNASCDEKIQITADDLTNPAGPSENYWKLLSEERRKALEATLNENEILHQRCAVLEAENVALKEALQSATEVIEVLNEIVAEDKETDETESEPKTEDSTSAKCSPAKKKRSDADDAFGNDSTVLDDSDNSD